MSTDRQATLKRLLRAIALSEGDFALLLARCNSIEVRDCLVADLKAQLGSGLYDRHITDADGVVNLVDILDEVGEGTQVISVTGLEASPHLHDILALANNAREEFRKRFKFPLVLWVTDDVEAELRRRSPDLASWAAPPFDFALDRAELQAMLERETADVLDWAFAAREGKRGIGQELQWAWQEWQRLEENRSPELAAKVALVFGIEAGSGDAAREHFENCLAQVSTGSLAAAARYRLGLWWQLRGKQERIDFRINCDRARVQLQMAWQEPEGKQASVALALGEILLALALPETGKATQWEALANFANELVILPDWAAGLRAEVAIARQDWQAAKAEAEKALQGQERQGFYLLSLGRSLIGMNLAKEAIAPLERAKALVLPEVDPDLHIRILQALHRAYTAVGNYRDAFTVKCDRESVETSYGFRAFIGAGRLQPQRRVGAIGEDAMEEVAASGRQADIEALVDRVKRSDCRLTVVHGPSGVGKSSLLQSGLVPALRKVIHQSRSIQPVVIEHYEDWQGELASKLGRSPLAPLVKGGKEEDLEVPLYKGDLGGSESLIAHKLGRSPLAPLVKGGKEEEDLEVPLYKGDLGGSESLIAQLHDRDRQNLITVLIFDQFEEFFFKHTDVPARCKLYDFLRECLAVPYVWVILSLREDYIHYLLECDRLANIELINNDILNKNVRYYLGNFSKERAKAVIKELTERSPYRLEEALVDRLVADLAAEFGEVRPIELQVVGAQMLHREVKITTLAAYEGLGKNPKQALVERWLTQVVQECKKDNEELAEQILYAFTDESGKRLVKTKNELQRDIKLLMPDLSTEVQDVSVKGDLSFVLNVLTGSGLAIKIVMAQESCYQLIHDYLVPPIRQLFGGKLEKQLADERQKRKQAEKAREENILNSQAIADSLYMKGVMDSKSFNLEEQVVVLEKAQTWQGKITELKVGRIELLATLHRAASLPKEKNRFEETQSITTVAFSPDGQSILTGGDNSVTLWSYHGQLLQIINRGFNRLISVSFSPDGQNILTGSRNGMNDFMAITSENESVKAELWSLGGQLLQSFELKFQYNQKNHFTSVAFSPDGQILLTVNEDNIVRLWSRHNQQMLLGFQVHQATVTSVVFSPDGQSLITGSIDNTAKLWNRDGRLLQTFQGHQGSITSIAFSPNGQTMLTGSMDNTAKLWNFDGRLLQTFQGHQDSVASVAFSSDGQSILTGSMDNTARLWSIDGKLLQILQGHQASVTSVAFSPDGQSLLTGSSDKTARLWSIKNHFIPSFQENRATVTSVAFSPNGQSLLIGSMDKTAKLYSLDGHLLQIFQEHQENVTSVAFSPNGQSVLTGSGDHTAKLWGLDGRLLQTFLGYYPAYVTSVAFSPDGQSVLTGSMNDMANLWSINGELLQTFQGHNAFVTSVVFSPDGQNVLTGSFDNTVKLWDLDGKVMQNFEGHLAAVYSIAFSPDGQSILTGSGDHTAKLWGLYGRLLQTFQGHQAAITSVAFAPDGQGVLTGSGDHTTKLWSLDGRLLQTFKGHQSAITSVEFAPSGQSILTGSWDKTVKLWNFDLKYSLALLCEHLHDFASVSNTPNIPEKSWILRQRAQKVFKSTSPPT
ncbi:hypothetical protein B9G53_04340 [Pseudanabaena sp. SR411]|uniref:WD40 repeat domain-containing protein n=1 Tax=Pseudanabaena sp. SR411 TaxID=1980935 RepID=UPI000B98498E|nr:WD40 repeat domain-containing protein [Pseudanabaena sp. SR411]OYQ66391.1 hypothetical protein B9G53_04340 [Pseudanabaena sp. SR411]